MNRELLKSISELCTAILSLWAALVLGLALFYWFQS